MKPSIPKMDNIPVWVLLLLVGGGTSGVGVLGGYFGAEVNPNVRPDPYTGKMAENDFAKVRKEFENEFSTFRRSMLRCSRDLRAVEVRVASHNDEALVWKGKIIACEERNKVLERELNNP